jgi:hypothetical protein
MAPAERDSETVSVSPVPHDACVCVQCCAESFWHYIHVGTIAAVVVSPV